jgi:uncharacterized protein (TIGR01777 family)
MIRKVVITGGTGTIGKILCKKLAQQGFEVAVLARKKIEIPHGKVYVWDIRNGYIEEGALEGTHYLIHLAGAGIADSRWTAERKKEILESRTKSISFIGLELYKLGVTPLAFVSTSGSGYYGGDTGDVRKREGDPEGTGFLSQVCVEWEAAAAAVTQLGVRTVIFRAGVVLSQQGGALSKMALPARYGIGAPLGSGKQWVSWIHVQDLCNLYIQALTNTDWEGVYNAVAPTPVTNKMLTDKICETLHRPQWLFNVPAVALRMAFGEMSEVVLGSSYVENYRIQKETNFKYEFASIDRALFDLLV